MPPSQWQLARQRDFSGGETLAKLPEKVGRNQLIRMENCLISPEGLITESWQLDQPLFINVSGGIVVVPVPDSTLYRVFGAIGSNIIGFTFDPASPTPYDMADAEGYPGYSSATFSGDVTILGISHGTPFLGKNYCCAATTLYVVGNITADPASIAFGTKQVNSVSQSTITITNTSEEVITLTGAYTTGGGAGRFGHTATFPQTLAVDDEYTFDISYNPNTAEISEATLNIANTLGVLRIALAGTAETMVAISNSNYDFGTKNISVETAGVVSIVTNNGPNPVSISSLTFTGDDAAVFTVNETLPITVAAGGSKTVSVKFKPTESKTCHATLDIKTSVGNTTDIALSGTGAVLIGAEPSSIFAYGTGQWDQTVVGTLIHNYSTTDTMTITSIQLATGVCLVILPGPPLPIDVPPGGSVPVSLLYTYPYRGFASNDILKAVTGWGEVDVSVVMTGV